MRRWLVAFVATIVVAPLATGSPAGAQDEPLSWWALGDSYSSGEGIPGTEPPASGQPECARASGNNTEAKAWAVVARETLAEPRISSWAFEPCTGAISSDVAGQLAQASSASGSDQADTVTLSMGGNNILFPDVVKSCLDLEVSWSSLSPGCNVDEDTLRRRIDMLAGATAAENGQYIGITLPTLYDQIAAEVRPGGAVVVLGYPQIVEEVGRWDSWRRKHTRNCEGVESFDIAMLRSVAGYLNQQIALAVQAADQRWSDRGIRFHWRDIATGVYETGEDPSQRHALCTPDPWLNGSTIGITSRDFRYQRSFHPMQVGHSTTGAWLGDWMRTHLGIDRMGPRRELSFGLRSVGPVRIGADADSAIAAGELEFEFDDVCTAEIDGSTEDDSYLMPSPEGTDVSLLIIEGTVFSYRADGRWSTDFGVSNGQDVFEVAERFQSEGWDVTVSGDDDIFGPGRLEASRGEDLFTIQSDDAGRSEVLWVPRPIYCD